MRWVAILPGVLLLAGCGADETALEPAASPDEVVFERHWPGHIAVNDEFRIQASFGEVQPVCVADSGTHIHGFYQFLDGDCADDTANSGRFISVYANYNTPSCNWEEAAARYCGAETEPFELGMTATGSGRFSACIPKLCGEQFVITAVYLSDSPGMDEHIEAEGGGPDLVYFASLGTTEATREEDLAAFRRFLSRLRLDGGTFHES